MTDKQKQWIVWGVMALVIAVIGFLGISLPVQLPPTPQVQARQILPTAAATVMIPYYVTNGSSGFVFGGTIYTATSGQVSLSSADRTYYQDLIDAGVLKTTTASGSGIFLSGSLLRIGSGATLDMQSGSIVSTTAFVGNPAFAGNVTVTGTTALIGNATAAGTFGVTGATALNGGLAMDTNKFTVADTSGNVATAGTLAVTGAATHSSTTALVGETTATGIITASGGIVLPAGGITQGGLVFTATSPLTLTGVLTNVRLLYYQVP